MYFCYALRGQLDEEKFVTATEQLLLSFPALGASLDFTGVPALDMRNITLPLSFASWPGGSVQDLLGPQNASKRLPFGISLCDTIKVSIHIQQIFYLNRAEAFFWNQRVESVLLLRSAQSLPSRITHIFL